MKQSHKDLKAMLICTVIAIVATLIAYAIVFADFGWWLS